jgi:hypothetical protein
MAHLRKIYGKYCIEVNVKNAWSIKEQQEWLTIVFRECGKDNIREISYYSIFQMLVEPIYSFLI